MAGGEVLDRLSAPAPTAASSASPPSPRRSRRSMHRALGGGAVADVLLWRRRNVGILVVTAATAVWFLFERAGYSFLSLMANAFLLLVVILFFWAKSASLLNRPLPPLPNLEVSEEFVGKVADEARVCINRVLAVGHDIAIRRDRKVFLQVTLLLWLVSYIGSLFNFLTLVYIGVLLSITLPALYDNYQDHVDEKLSLAHKLLLKHCDNILRRGTRKPAKEKKIQ
ncbi:reticulon-like protein B11 [Elaeis guineensis]|uniref:Reticulon-like protein n=1 Tax=Elaeis guineensis var. tenera TaxID=51953 RepID=A0A6I9RLH6_ELAGV|nr:reticulon-like protein B11 [Elaeis guineensis]XP_010928380.1 reticulon-like protein B11 [Elaeis guineensis]XP_029121962.1 reticulon-like protein B11 [Elaeis guineensis]